MKSDKYLGTIRILIGLMFLLIGIVKLTDVAGVSTFFGSLGIPASLFFAWVVALSETLFGLAVLIGYKIKYTAWPLVVIFVIAILLAILPNVGFNSGSISILFFHLTVIAALVHFAMNGAGSWAVDKK